LARVLAQASRHERDTFRREHFLRQFAEQLLLG
jgi:hypothetical protein